MSVGQGRFDRKLVASLLPAQQQHVSTVSSFCSQSGAPWLRDAGYLNIRASPEAGHDTMVCCFSNKTMYHTIHRFVHIIVAQRG
jgi:hypothetical protein